MECCIKNQSLRKNYDQEHRELIRLQTQIFPPILRVIYCIFSPKNKKIHPIIPTWYIFIRSITYVLYIVNKVLQVESRTHMNACAVISHRKTRPKQQSLLIKLVVFFKENWINKQLLTYNLSVISHKLKEL